MSACRTKIRPPLIPFYEEVEVTPGTRVAVVRVTPGFAVHSRWHDQHSSYYIRVGTTSQEASSEELARLFQGRGSVRAELRPLSGAGLSTFDPRRLEEYFVAVRQQAVPRHDDEAGWLDLLVGTELMVDAESGRDPVASVAGHLLFGRSPARFLPFAAIAAAAYPGPEKEYATLERAHITGPLTPLGADGMRTEPSIIEHSIAFVLRNTRASAEIQASGQRVDRPAVPVEVLREVLVNAVVHRDYFLVASDIELSVYSDRIEVISPGRLPNGITPERMRKGTRAARNQLVKDVLRDYRLLEHMGLGIPRIVIKGMAAHNGTTPDLVALDDERFVVRLWILDPARDGG